MEAKVKPGTRCECNDYATVGHLHTVTLLGALIAKPEGGTIRGPQRTKNVERCPNEAVRMVTVPCVCAASDPLDYDTEGPEIPIRPPCECDPVPMCAACAAFHKARQKERV